MRYTNLFISGYFYAPDLADESVLGMCTNSNNSLLVTGDTQGNIKVWDIMSYCIKPQDRGVSISISYISFEQFFSLSLVTKSNAYKC